MIRALRLALLTSLATVSLVVPAAASDIPAGALHTLAAAAARGDQTALAAVRSVTSVDGRPMSPASALAGASPAELRARLQTLAADQPGSTVATADLARRAAAIAGDHDRTETGTTSTVDIGGLPAIVWLALGTLVLIASAVVTRRSLRRLDAVSRNPTERSRSRAGAEPDLERQAVDAEARGAFSEAVRLRFRAGLKALARRSVIESRASLRTAEISRRLRSPEFDRLAATFERIAYGGASASAADAAEAREGWRRVLAAGAR